MTFRFDLLCIIEQSSVVLYCHKSLVDHAHFIITVKNKKLFLPSIVIIHFLLCCLRHSLWYFYLFLSYKLVFLFLCPHKFTISAFAVQYVFRSRKALANLIHIYFGQPKSFFIVYIFYQLSVNRI